MVKIADRREVPEAERRPGRLAFKDGENQSGQLLALDDHEGIVTAIVSVTGTEDEVNDIILPGAYAATLAKRRPKVCWAHAWEHPIGKVLHIEEIQPGDDRLPTQTKDGKPWPREAGALVATMQFNLRSDEGKNAFEAVRFYSETGECEYSIGYQVPAGQSTRDRKGVRHIKALELYELSVVLFGAHTMTGTLSIKAALDRKATMMVSRPVRTAAEIVALAMEGKATPPFVKKAENDAAAAAPGEEAEHEFKDDDGNGLCDTCNLSEADGNHTPAEAPAPPAEGAPAAPPVPGAPAAPAAPPAAPAAPADEKPPGTGDTVVTGVPDFSDGVMIALYPDPGAADALAAAIAGPDETLPKEDLHVTLAYLGKVSDSTTITSDELVRIVTEAMEGQNALSGEVGGLGIFPEAEDSENGPPTWVPVDVPGLSLLREQIINALGDKAPEDRHGFTPHITIGYDIGLPDPIDPIPVTFDSVAIVYGQQTREVPLNAPTEDGQPWEAPEEKARMTALLDGLAQVPHVDRARMERWATRRSQDLGYPLPEGWDPSEVKSIVIPCDEDEAATLEEEIKAYGIADWTDPEYIVLTETDDVEGKAGGADRNRGGAEKLRHYWTVGEGGLKIAWGTPGDFTRCVRLLDEHMPGRAEGYCANRHKEMNGFWPGDDRNKAAGYDPAFDVIVTETKTYENRAPMVTKGYPRLPGTVEEQQDLLMAAVSEALRGDEVEDGRWEWPGVCIDGTYPDGRLIASRMKYDGTEQRESFEFTWEWDDGTVTLGEPEPVTLKIVAVEDPDAFPDDDGPSTYVTSSDALPALAADVNAALAGFKSATGPTAPMEAKAGRVLSGANERAIRETVENLVEVLRKAGVRIQVADLPEDEETPRSASEKPDERPIVDPSIDTETTSPTASGRKSLDGETVTLDAAALAADLAALQVG